MIDWAKYFDRIYCIHYTEYTKRREHLEFELNRVGILNSGIFEYKFTNGSNEKFNKWFFENFCKSYSFNKNNYNYVDVALNHYYCIRDAYFRGYNRVLILEDDIRFLRDLNKIEQYLNNRPDNGSVILYDYYIKDYTYNKQFVKVNNYYNTFNSCWSAGCYQLDRKGMERIIQLQENFQLRNPDEYFNNVNYAFKDLKCYCSNINLAIQCQYNISEINTNTNYTAMKQFVNYVQRCYKYRNIDFDDYYIKMDGTAYYYGDQIQQIKIMHNLVLTDDNKQIINTNKNIQPIQMNICFAVTFNQIDKLVPIIYSIQKYSKSKIHFYIILDKQEIKQQYYNLFKPFINQQMDFTLVDSKIIDQNLNPQLNNRLTKMTYAKLFLPKLFPTLDKLLYLDYDIIVLNKGIEWLYNIDFENNYVAACEDRLSFNNLILDYTQNLSDEWNMFKNKTKLYFNAGVMMWNLKKIREDGKDEQLLKLAKTSQSFQIHYEDQSILNLVFQNTCLNINHIFNNMLEMTTNCFRNLMWKKKFKQIWKWNDKFEFFENVIICHFACTYLKPWNYSPNYLYQDGKKIMFYSYNNIITEMVDKLNEYYLV